MTGSLSRRIVVLCATICLFLAILAGLLLEGAAQTRSSLAWVTHSTQVMRTANQALLHLQQAESGERGFLLTRQPDFGETVQDEVAASRKAAADLVTLTSDNPAQSLRAKQIRLLIHQRATLLEEIAQQASNGDFTTALNAVASRRGRNLMQHVNARVGDLLAAERHLSTSRTAAVKRRLDFITWVVLIGVPLGIAAVTLLAALLVRRIRRPMEAMMTVMSQLAAGDRSARIQTAMESSEFERLAREYNAMADQLQAAVAHQEESQDRLHAANAELSRNTEILQERGEVIELLGGMAHRMQAARTDEELAAIIRVFAPRVLPDLPGRSTPTTIRATCWRLWRAGAVWRFPRPALRRSSAGLYGAGAAITWPVRSRTSSAPMSTGRSIATIANPCSPAAKSSASCISPGRWKPRRASD
ncbi:CHASE3 domain-containing protein [Novosphingobium panipatense]